MDKVVSVVAVAPLRKAASHASEMCSQLLFGETAFLLDKQDGFCLLRCVYDGYEGWCAANQLQSITTATETMFTTSIFTEVLYKGKPIQLPLGSIVSTLESAITLPAKAGIRTEPLLFNATTITEQVMLFLNAPYLWGGKSVFGIDCSGFAQQVMKQFGFVLPRDAHQQVEKGESIGFLQEAVCGDLAFFDDAAGNIIHVGILLDASTIIHAAGVVRMDPIDHMGIIHYETGERTHTLRIIKRLV